MTTTGGALKAVEARLWDAADGLRANSGLRASEYSTPVLGLIFLRYADQRFGEAEHKFALADAGRNSTRPISKEEYQAEGVLFLPPEARFGALLALPEGANLGAAINEAMRAIERENDELGDVLPKTYGRLDNATLVTLLKNFAAIATDAATDLEGDAFG